MFHNKGLKGITLMNTKVHLGCHISVAGNAMWSRAFVPATSSDLSDLMLKRKGVFCLSTTHSTHSFRKSYSSLTFPDIGREESESSLVEDVESMDKGESLGTKDDIQYSRGLFKKIITSLIQQMDAKHSLR